MKIWVDADACPTVIKEILFRVAIRTKISVILVANQQLYLPPSVYIKKLIVQQGFDVADNVIISKLEEGDLVITADLPLANQAIEKKCFALNPRGILYSPNNIKNKLSIRNFHETLRGAGIATKGPVKLNKKDIQEFANHLDRFISKNIH